MLGALASETGAAGLTRDDVLLLVVVVAAGLGLSWIVLRLVLRETAAFSRHFPRDEGPATPPPPEGEDARRAGTVEAGEDRPES